MHFVAMSGTWVVVNKPVWEDEKDSKYRCKKI